MMDVIIVSKTKMYNTTCVGGIFANGRSVRLLDANGNYQDNNTVFSIGDVYTIEYQELTNKRPPHIENIIVTSQKFKFSFASMSQMINYLVDKLKINIWNGAITTLFENKLQWTTPGSGYISEQSDMPNHSTGFWIPDQDLIRSDYQRDNKIKVRYSYSFPVKQKNRDDLWEFSNTNIKYMPFVGFQKPINIIPAGTLVRVSLAKWVSLKENEEEKCWLQLSGWYIDK